MLQSMGLQRVRHGLANEQPQLVQLEVETIQDKELTAKVQILSAVLLLTTYQLC